MDELWPALRARIDDADLDGVAELLAGAAAGERAALLSELEAYEPGRVEPERVELPPVKVEPDPELPSGSFGFAFFATADDPVPPRTAKEVRAYLGRQRLQELQRERDRERRRRQHEADRAAERHTEGRRAARALAIAACTAKAADVVRAAYRPWRTGPRLALPVEAAGALVRIRGTAWCATLADGMARRSRSQFPPWPFTEALLRAVGAPLPAEPAAVAEYVSMWRGNPLAPLLAADPWLDAALPYLFDDDRVGAAFGTGTAGRDWPPALLELAATGRVPRATLVAGCLRRLLTGGRPGLLAPYLSLLTALEPGLDELSPHERQLVGLLGAPGPAIAGFAHATLLALHDKAPLEPDTVADMTAAALARPEKKLVRAHLVWLRRRPELVPGLLDSLLAGLHHPAPELAGRTLDLLAPHLATLPPAARDRLVAEVPALDGDIAGRLATLLGTAVAAPPPAPAPLPVAGPPAEMPPPLDLDGLATEIAALLRGDEPDPVAHELVLDGLVRAARGDRDAAARALGPLVPAWGGPWPDLIAAAAGRPAPPVYLPGPVRGLPVLAEFVNRRLAELAAGLAADPPPALLATPATVAGHADPERVLALLAAAERDGRQPGPADLNQALLRLPRDPGPAVRAGAARLASPAGRALAAWLDDAAGEPRTWVEAVAERGWQRPAQRIAMLDAAGLPAPVADPRPADGRVAVSRFPRAIALWPMVTPLHREVAAAHVQPFAAATLESGNLGTGVLAGLAAADGPAGPAMALTLAYTLANHRHAVRLAAGDAFLALAARPGWTGAGVGEQLAALATADMIVLRRVVDPLTEALRGGAHDAVWQLAAAALPALLATPESRRRPGLADLVELAAAAARATGRPAGSLPAVTGLTAAAAGRGALAAAARRLGACTAAG